MKLQALSRQTTLDGNFLKMSSKQKEEIQENLIAQFQRICKQISKNDPELEKALEDAMKLLQQES